MWLLHHGWILTLRLVVHAYAPENQAEISEEEHDREIVPEEDPELLEWRKKDVRNAKARMKRATAKCTREVEDEGMAEDGRSEVDSEEPPWKKKLKKKTKKTKKSPLDIFNSDDDDAEEPVRFTVYFTIEGPPPILPTTSRSRAPPPKALSVQKGPFFHLVSDTYSTLKERIALETPCNVNLLAIEGLTWKFDKPLNGPRRKMANQIGYDAMIAAVSKKPSDTCTVEMHMPPPRKDLVNNFLNPVSKHYWSESSSLGPLGIQIKLTMLLTTTNW
jgi:hypothetical protein